MPKKSGRFFLTRFFERYQSRTLIIHCGFPVNWLGELLKQPGGGGHFRIDASSLRNNPTTPVEYLILHHILPLDLPMPILCRVENDHTLYLRHLTRGGSPVHPSEIFWFMEEITQRHHFCLFRNDDALNPVQGIPLTDNEAHSMLDNL